MKRIYILFSILICLAIGGSVSAFMFIGGGITSAACTSTICGTPDLACDTLEGSTEESWARTGNDIWTFAGAARGSCSDDYWVVTNPVQGDYQSLNFSAANNIAYAEFWWKFTNGPDDDTDDIDFAVIRDVGGNNCMYLTLTNDSGTLKLSLGYVNGGSGSVTVTVVAGTCYHIGMYFNDTANEAAWYVSEADALGAAEETITSLSTTRDPEDIKIGAHVVVGAFSITMNYDSITIDTSAFTPVEY